GMTDWTQINEYQDDFKVLKEWRTAKFADKEEKLAALSVSDILKDEDLTSYAIATSKALYGDYCAACHAAGGAGNTGFPVLADDDWLWGGSIAQIEASIENGRVGNMPAKGMMGTLTDQEVSDVTDYVIALAEGKGDDVTYASGKAVYTKGMCMACHGSAGVPMAPTGAANLADGIWRFGSDRDVVLSVIANGVNVKKSGVHIEGTRQAVMPSFKERLPNADVNVKRLAVYVHSLGGGQ
ncbi:MAG: c-type cytochrome, partial [Thiomicrorhabdus sp.]|nr:c-type cytochrome [Thiomicrorhabdus sp.]